MKVTEAAPVTAVAPTLRSPGLGSVRAFRAVLWLIVVAGPVMAVWASAQVADANRDLEALTIKVEASRPAVSTAAVEGFAELAVADFLVRGHNESGQHEIGANGWLDVRTVSVGVEEVVPRYFAVTVAATRPTVGVSFYTIGISESAAGWAAVSGPSLIAAPAAVPAPQLAVARSGGIDDVAGLSQALEGFLSALLIGDGDIARYVAPGSNVSAVTPPPFTSVEVTAGGSVPWAEGTQLVTADVEGSTGDGATQLLTYSVVFAERDGRWEVVELLAAPPLAGPPMTENQEKRSRR